ncbi:hypothetical protein FQN55_002520 [Onygenales sp. PD_40]|nr:hypothetical protein FQN55_002520 [Onygenales sp. PD_40]
MPTPTSPQPSPLHLAILDDYQSLSPPKFHPLTTPHPNLTITTHPHTLHPTHNAHDKQTLISLLHPYQIISTMRERTPFPASLLTSLPNLKLLLTTGTRNRAIDLPTCAAHGIIVAGTTGVKPGEEKLPTPSSTVQHTWALILGLARHIARDDASVKGGGWQGDSLAMGLAGKTLGIVGLGKLGAATGRIGIVAFGMRVVAWSSNLTQEAADERAVELGLPVGSFVVVRGKEELFRVADVVSLHYVLSERSRGMVGGRELGVMKSSALLVNTSRGPLVEEGELLETLKRGGIRGAALDVFDREPLAEDSEWRTTEWGVEGRSEVLLTPHMGYGEEEIMNRWYEEQAENLGRWLEGKEVLNRLS